MLQDEIKEALIKAVSELNIPAQTIVIDYPADPHHGDYATNVALVAAKKIARNPRELAEDIRLKIKDVGMFEKVEIAGPGFINFWIKEEALVKEVSDNNMPQVGRGQKLIVEYSSPNIAKPFTIGHLRSTIIGDAIANLLEAVGYTVFRDNHIGDWGTQFGKQIAALKYIDYETKDRIENLNDLDNLKKNIALIENSNNPVNLLVEFYVLFHEMEEKYPAFPDLAREEFKELELSNEKDELREYHNRWLWKKCIEWSWKEFSHIYKLLDVSFTENDGRGYGEAFFEDRMIFVLHELKEKKLIKEGKEGAKIVEFPQEFKLPPLMILKKDGATLYSTRDLATDKFRIDHYGKDITIINEVGIEQSLYFQQLYKLEEMLGWFNSGQRVHVKHGHYRFKEGKMSTRKGNVVLLKEVLDEAGKRAFSVMDEAKKQLGLSVPEQALLGLKIGIGALKWNDLKRDSKQDINFDWDEILNMQGNSGPYLQYTYVRTKSVLEKAGETKNIELDKSEISLTTEERDMLRLLARFPQVVEEAAMRYAPHIVCTYLFDLAQAFNLFYQKLPILKAKEDERNLRLHITKSTGVVLKQGLQLLGISAPEKM